MRVPKISTMALAMVLAIPVTPQAAEWSVAPKVSLQAGYNDNIRLTAADHDSVWETSLFPAVEFGVATEINGLVGDAGFAIRRFTGGSGLDSGDELNREDYFLKTNAYHNTLKDRFSLDLDYTRDSTLDSELDNGVTTRDRATRELLAIGPSWSRSLTALTGASVSYQGNIVSYKDDPGISDLVDYVSHSISGNLSHQLSQRISGNLAAGYSLFQPETNFDSTTWSLQAGLTSSISETLVASAMAGQRWTTSDSFIGTGFCIGALPGASFPSCSGGIPFPTGVASTEFETSAPVYSASLTRTLETGALSATVSRTSSPDSDGELLDTTRLILSGDYKLTETITSTLRASYIENETIVNRLGRPSQATDSTFQVTPKVAWNWQREWTLSGEYRYASVDRASIDSADRNALYFTLSYKPLKQSISR